jgi:hypothetical protein
MGLGVIAPVNVTPFINEHTVEIGSIRIKPSTERRPQHHRNSDYGASRAQSDTKYSISSFRC